MRSPLLDMLRYHKLLAGASWVDEYGSPEVPAERAWLERFSPYQNLVKRPDFPVLAQRLMAPSQSERSAR
jgi:prolyl oligopeptidase